MFLFLQGFDLVLLYYGRENLRKTVFFFLLNLGTPFESCLEVDEENFAVTEVLTKGRANNRELKDRN